MKLKLKLDLDDETYHNLTTYCELMNKRVEGIITESVQLYMINNFDFVRTLEVHRIDAEIKSLEKKKQELLSVKEYDLKVE